MATRLCDISSEAYWHCDPYERGSSGQRRKSGHCRVLRCWWPCCQSMIDTPVSYGCSDQASIWWRGIPSTCNKRHAGGDWPSTVRHHPRELGFGRCTDEDWWGHDGRWTLRCFQSRGVRRPRAWPSCSPRPWWGQNVLMRPGWCKTARLGALFVLQVTAGSRCKSRHAQLRGAVEHHCGHQRTKEFSFEWSWLGGSFLTAPRSCSLHSWCTPHMYPPKPWTPMSWWRAVER